MSMFKQEVIIIAAVSPEGIIAIDGQMPWHQPEDLKRFKKLTTDNVLLYGRKTFDSFNRKPLPGRQNYIISTTLDTQYDNNYVSIFPNLEDAISTSYLLYGIKKKLYIGGGANIYEQTLPIADRIELTIINKDQVCYHDGIKTFFPKFENKMFLKDFELENVDYKSTCCYATYKRKAISSVNKIRSLFLQKKT